MNTHDSVEKTHVRAWLATCVIVACAFGVGNATASPAYALPPSDPGGCVPSEEGTGCASEGEGGGEGSPGEESGEAAGDSGPDISDAGTGPTDVSGAPVPAGSTAITNADGNVFIVAPGDVPVYDEAGNVVNVATYNQNTGLWDMVYAEEVTVTGQPDPEPEPQGIPWLIDIAPPVVPEGGITQPPIGAPPGPQIPHETDDSSIGFFATGNTTAHLKPVNCPPGATQDVTLRLNVTDSTVGHTVVLWHQAPDGSWKDVWWDRDDRSGKHTTVFIVSKAGLAGQNVFEIHPSPPVRDIDNVAGTYAAHCTH